MKKLTMKFVVAISLLTASGVALADANGGNGPGSNGSPSVDFNHMNDEYYKQQKVLMDSEDAKFRAQIQNESQSSLRDEASKIRSQSESDCTKQALMGALAQAWNMGLTGALGWVDKLDPRYKTDPNFHRDVIEMHDSIWNFEPFKEAVSQPTMDNECLKDARKLAVVDGLLQRQ